MGSACDSSGTAPSSIVVALLSLLSLMRAVGEHRYNAPLPIIARPCQMAG